jgi:hypothetical protein
VSQVPSTGFERSYMKSIAPAVLFTLGVCLLSAAAVGGGNSDVDLRLATSTDTITAMDGFSSGTRLEGLPENICLSTTARATRFADDSSGGSSGVAFIACQSDACADHQQAPVVVAIPDPVQACFPEHLHPISRQYLDAFFLGHISRAQFLRGFPLPNSDYLPVEDCIIAAIDTPAEAELAAPAPR